MLSSIRYTRGDFYSAVIVTERDVLYANSNYIRADPLPNFDWSQEAWFARAVELKGEIFFLPPHIPRYYDRVYDSAVCSLVGTIRNLRTREAYAVIKIDFLPSSFDRFLKNADFHVPSCAFITDADGNLIYEHAATERMRRMVSTDSENKITTDFNKIDAFHLSRPVSRTGYTLSVLLDGAAVRMRSLRIYAVGIVFYLAAFFLALVLNRRFSRRVAEPIEEVKRVLGEVQKGDFSVSFHGRPRWELQEVGESVNTMIRELDRTINNLYVAELDRRDAENRALLSQIQPHFLFNTIDSMIALLYENRTDELEESLYSLSNMLHYVLRKEQTVTLAEELDFVKSYLHLQHARFRDRLFYTVTLDEESGSVVVPRLVLQPFVENAVIHGMEPLARATHVNVEGKSERGVVLLAVDDDGAGFDSARIDITQGVGISNCVSRLRLLYPESSVAVESAAGRGCHILIKIINFKTAELDGDKTAEASENGTAAYGDNT